MEFNKNAEDRGGVSEFYQNNNNAETKTSPAFSVYLLYTTYNITHSKTNEGEFHCCL
jgi:hypothetical protein